jgi:GAF domain-containing protein
MDESRRISLDRLAAGAAALLEVPLVLISLVDRNVGTSLSGVPVNDEPSPLSYEVAALGRPIISQDVRRRVPAGDPRGCGFQLAAYAGLPFPIANGARLGAFAAFSPTARNWHDRDLLVLRSFAEAAGAILDAYERRPMEMLEIRHQPGDAR